MLQIYKPGIVIAEPKCPVIHSTWERVNVHTWDRVNVQAVLRNTL